MHSPQSARRGISKSSKSHARSLKQRLTKTDPGFLPLYFALEVLSIDAIPHRLLILMLCLYVSSLRIVRMRVAVDFSLRGNFVQVNSLVIPRHVQNNIFYLLVQFYDQFPIN